MIRIKKVQLAFRKGWVNKSGFDGLYAFFIMIRSWSLFTHVELKLPNGLSFSSVDEGVRFKKIKYSHPDRWQFVELDVVKLINPVTKINFNNAQELYDFCKTIHGDYDWTGIVLYEGLPFGIDDPGKWWCSEVCSYVIGLIKYKINPGELFNIARKKLN